MMRRCSVFALLSLAFPAMTFPIPGEVLAGKSGALVIKSSSFAQPLRARPKLPDGAAQGISAPFGFVSILIIYALKQMQMNTGDKLPEKTYSYPPGLNYSYLSCAI